MTPARAAGIRLRGWIGGGLSPNFWRLWTSSVAANLADGITLVALPLVAVRLTSSPAEIAGITAAFLAPALIFGLPAGGLADRLDRRWTMLAAQVLRVGVLATLAMLVILDALSVPALYAAAFVLGTGETFFDTNATAITPQLVGRDRLVSANGRLFAAETVANQFIGPPLGGLLVAVALPVALGGGALGFAIAAIGLLLISGRFHPEREGPPRSLAVEIVEGLAFLARHRLLLTLTSMVALGRLGSSAFFSVFVLFAVAPGPMGLSEPQFGLLFLLSGLGSLAGSVVAARLVAWIGRAQVLLLAQLLFGGTLFVPVFTADLPAMGAAFFLNGVSVMSWNVTNVSLRQAILPPRLLGRVNASHRFIANVAGLLGALLGGVVGEAIGLPAAFALGAGIVLVAGLGRLIVTDARIAAAESEAGR